MDTYTTNDILERAKKAVAPVTYRKLEVYMTSEGHAVIGWKHPLNEIPRFVRDEETLNFLAQSPELVRELIAELEYRIQKETQTVDACPCCNTPVSEQRAPDKRHPYSCPQCGSI